MRHGIPGAVLGAASLVVVTTMWTGAVTAGEEIEVSGSSQHRIYVGPRRIQCSQSVISSLRSFVNRSPKGCNMAVLDLPGADLSGVGSRMSQWVGWTRGRFSNLRDANLNGVFLQGASLIYSDLRGADFRDAYLGGAYLGGANLRDADLGNANLRGADLDNADLRGANLNNADLRGANLNNADLRGANLDNADLRGAALHNTIVRDVDLRNAIRSIR